MGVGVEAGTQVSVTGEVWRSAAVGYRLAYSDVQEHRTLSLQRLQAWTLFRQESGGIASGPQLTAGLGAFVGQRPRLFASQAEPARVGLTGRLGLTLPFSWVFEYYNTQFIHRFSFSAHATPWVGTREESRLDFSLGVRYYF